MNERHLIEQFLQGQARALAKTHRLLLEAYLSAVAEAGQPNVARSVYAEAVARLEGKRIEPYTLDNRLSRLNTHLGEKRAGFRLVILAGEVRAQSGKVADADARGLMALEGLAQQQNVGAVESADAVQARALKSKPDLQVFFSYGWHTEPGDDPDLHRVHEAFADALALALKRRSALPSAVACVALYRDARRLRDHDDLTDAYMSACKASFLLLAMLSGKYLGSALCRKERGVFIARGRRRPGRAVIVMPFDRGDDALVEIGLDRGRFKVASPSTHETILKLWAKGDADDRQSYVDRIVESIFVAAAEHVETMRSTAVVDRPSVLEEVSRDEPMLEDERLIVALAKRHGLSPQIHRHPGESRDPTFNMDRPLRSVPSGGVGPGLRRDDEEDDAEMGVPIVDHLIGWARDPDPLRARVFALLGEFGMGKTVNCRLFARRLLEMRSKDRTLPLPVYFDLRDAGALDPKETVALPALVRNLLRRSFQGVNADELIAAMRRENVVVVFDGLDEVTNKFSPAQAADFYRLLLSLVPGELWAGDKRRRLSPPVIPAKAGTHGAAGDRTRGSVPVEGWVPAFAGMTKDLGSVRTGPRLLVSCRTHFFQAVESERAFLSDKERQGLDVERDIETYFLLPFSGEQIGEYLRLHLADADAARLEALIRETYDLSELARRPVLLRFIREMAGRLEEEKLRGRTINVARLYDILVAQVLERDGGKHVLSLADKRLILEDLALHLHVSKTDEIANDKLFAWFRARMADDKLLGRALSGVAASEILETWLQDLRNASLLVRPGERAFRFAHTSVREFFLANALHRAVRDGKGAEVLGVGQLSDATLAYLLRRHEIEDGSERAAFEAEFPRLLRHGVALDVRQEAFEIWRQGEWLGREGVGAARVPRPDAMDMSGHLGMPYLIGLDLRSTVWAGGHIERIEHCDARNANFVDVRAQGSTWTNVNLEGANFERANLSLSYWRSCQHAGRVLVGADIRFSLAWDCGDFRPQGDLPSGPVQIRAIRWPDQLFLFPARARYIGPLLKAIDKPGALESVEFRDGLPIAIGVDSGVGLEGFSRNHVFDPEEQRELITLNPHMLKKEKYRISGLLTLGIVDTADQIVEIIFARSTCKVRYMHGAASGFEIRRILSLTVDAWHRFIIGAPNTMQLWPIEQLAERDGVRATEVERGA